MISQYTLCVSKSLLNKTFLLGLLLTILISSLGLINRILDRTSTSSWEVFDKAIVSDGRFYLFQSEQFRGSEKQDSIKVVESIFGKNALLPEDIEGIQMTMIKSRPLYPLLTAQLGDPSKLKLLLIPILSWLMIHILIYVLLIGKFKIHLTILTILVLSTSFYFRYNLIASSADALAALLVLPYLWICFSECKSKFWYVLVGICTIFALFTRPTAPLIAFVSLGIVYISKTKIEKFFHISAFIVSISHLFLLEFVYNQLTIQANVNGESFGLKFLLDSLVKLPKIVFFEFAFIAANDTFIFTMIIMAILVALFTTNIRAKLMMVLVFSSSFLSGAINGTLGNGFRYQIPFIFVSAFCLLDYISSKSTELEKVIRNDS